MKYYYVRADSDFGDFIFLVFTENKEDVEKLIYENDHDEKVYSISEIREVTPNQVMVIRQPGD